MPDTLNLWHQALITLGARAAQCRVALRRNMTLITGRGDLQHLAYLLDPVGVAMPVDERPYDLSLRSSSAWEKSAGQLQYLIGAAQFLHFAFQRFDAVAFLAGDAIAQTGVDLVLLHPVMQCL